MKFKGFIIDYSLWRIEPGELTEDIEQIRDVHDLRKEFYCMLLNCSEADYGNWTWGIGQTPQEVIERAQAVHLAFAQALKFAAQYHDCKTIIPDYETDYDYHVCEPADVWEFEAYSLLCSMINNWLLAEGFKVGQIKIKAQDYLNWLDGRDNTTSNRAEYCEYRYKKVMAGHIGGSTPSEKRKQKARENGKKGGRPVYNWLVTYTDADGNSETFEAVASAAKAAIKKVKNDFENFGNAIPKSHFKFDGETFQAEWQDKKEAFTAEKME